MPKKKTTIQDIANSLGFSRVTVSKALRNSADVSEKTKEIVLNRAKLMGYKTFQSDPLPDAFPLNLLQASIKVLLCFCI